MQEVTKPNPVTDRLALGHLAFLFLMMPLAVAAIWVGGTDLLSTASLGSRLFGATLVLVGVGLVIGYGALVVGASWARELALLACTAGVLIGVVLFVIQLAAYENWRLALWLGVVVVLAACVSVLLHAGARTAPLTKLGAVLSVGTVIGLAQLFYSSPYVPSAQQPNVSIDSSITRVGSTASSARSAPILALHGRVVVKNHSRSSMQTVGSVYLLVGVNTKPESRPVDESGWTTRVRTSFEQSSEVFRVTSDKEYEVLGAGVMYPVGYLLSPEDEDVFETTLYAPSRGFDSLFLLASIETASGDRLDLSDEPIATNLVDDENSPSEIWDEYSVRETSTVNKLTREPRYLHTGWTLKSDNSELVPGLSIYIDAESRRNKSFSDYNSRLERVYGLDFSSTTSETAL